METERDILNRLDELEKTLTSLIKKVDEIDNIVAEHEYKFSKINFILFIEQQKLRKKVLQKEMKSKRS